MVSDIDSSQQITIEGNVFLIKRAEFIISSNLILNEAINIASNFAQDKELLSTILEEESALENFKNNFCKRSESTFDSKLELCSQNINDSVFSGNQNQSMVSKDEVISSWIAHKLKLYTIKLRKVSQENELPHNLIEEINLEIVRVKSVREGILEQQKSYIAA